MSEIREQDAARCLMAPPADGANNDDDEADTNSDALDLILEDDVISATI